MKTRSLLLATIAVLLAGIVLAGCGDKDSPSAESLRIGAPPSKAVYKVGESLDLTGLSVYCRYSDGTESALTVSASDVTGFDSSAIVQDQVLTVSKSGLSARFSVHIVGDLVGVWRNGASQIALTLVGDFTGSSASMRGGAWSIDGPRLTLTYDEQYESGAWVPVTPTLYRWDWVLVGGKLYITEPFVRIGAGTTLVGTFEQVAWYDAYKKYRITIDASGALEVFLFPLSSSFDRQTESGTWDTSGTSPLMTASLGTPLPLPVAGTVTPFNATGSTIPALLPNGANNLVWSSVDRFGLDTSGWTKD
jgi:hypothetical protein